MISLPQRLRRCLLPNLLALCAAPTAWADAELSVARLIKPSSCTPYFSRNGTLDLGPIEHEQLAPGNGMRGNNLQIVFSITCQAASQVALRVTDNRPDSMLQGDFAPYHTHHLFGLGMADQARIGHFSMMFAADMMNIDGKPAKTLHTKANATDSASGWSRSENPDWISQQRLLTWTTMDSFSPAFFSTFSGTILFHVGFNRPEDLPIGREIKLDGSATFELHYL